MLSKTVKNKDSVPSLFENLHKHDYLSIESTNENFITYLSDCNVLAHMVRWMLIYMHQQEREKKIMLSKFSLIFRRICSAT